MKPVKFAYDTSYDIDLLTLTTDHRNCIQFSFKDGKLSEFYIDGYDFKAGLPEFTSGMFFLVDGNFISLQDTMNQARFDYPAIVKEAELEAKESEAHFNAMQSTARYV